MRIITTKVLLALATVLPSMTCGCAVAGSVTFQDGIFGETVESADAGGSNEAPAASETQDRDAATREQRVEAGTAEEQEPAGVASEPEPPEGDPTPTHNPRELDAAAGVATDGDDSAPQGDATPVASCEPGTYGGTFSAALTLQGRRGAMGFEFAGELTLFLEPVDSGKRLVVTYGHLVGNDNYGNDVTADLSGSLNCETGQLENGQLTHGVYEAAWADRDLEFEYELDGLYVPGDPPRFSGTWSSTDAMNVVEGTFQTIRRRPQP